jgi:large subunit ribosomal protein L6
VSRIGKLPIPIPSGVTVTVQGTLVQVTGPKGSLDQEVVPVMKVTVGDTEVLVERPSESKTHRSLHGLTRTLIANMIIGVTQGYKKDLQIVGVGYRAEKKGACIQFLLGFSHPIVLKVPEGVEVEIQGNDRLTVSGIDKQLVGQVAALIRSFRKPEPYKGKGIRYVDEQVRRKAGKAAA